MALLGPISEFFHSLKTWFLLFSAVLGTFLALLGTISEFCHRCECCSVLPYNSKKRFRQFPAKSNDSNWIRSPRSMFLHFIRGSQKGVKKCFRFLFCFFSRLKWLNSKKKKKIFFRKFVPGEPHFWAIFGPFWPNTNFPEKSDSATFYPSYTPNFMQKIRKN